MIFSRQHSRKCIYIHVNNMHSNKINVQVIFASLLRSISLNVRKDKFTSSFSFFLIDTWLCIKADTYALETDVHFPTDLNLLWDAGRKRLRPLLYTDSLWGLTLKFLNVSGYPLESINKIALLQSMRLERVRPKIRCPKLGIHARIDNRQCRFPPSCAKDG